MNPTTQQSNLRRSARARHPTSNGQALGKSSAQTTNNNTQTQGRRQVSKAAINSLLAKIYEEIHRASIKDTLNGRYATQELLFQARVCRFFDLLAPGDRITLDQTLQTYDVHDFRAGSIANEVKRALLVPHPNRLMDFCKDTSLLLLSICAHSQSFRESITGNDQSVARGKPRWDDIYPAIKNCASSLELFALSRPNFDCLNNLQAWNKHFSTTLEWVFSNHTDGVLKGINATNFGIEANDLTPIHHIEDEPEHKVHHHWILSRQAQRPAVRAEIEYTVTEDLSRVDFVNDYYAVTGRSRKGKGQKTVSPIPLKVGSLQKLKQLNIEKSVVLPNQPWPLGLLENVDGAPDFCSRPACFVCGLMGSTVTVGPNGRALSFSPASCSCTFKDYLKNQAAPFNDPKGVLVELYTTEETGVGVRSLQRISRKVPIGAYFGEIYPEKEVATGQQLVRYGKPKGDVYHLSVESQPSPSEYDEGGGFTVDAGHLGNWTRYMNHSCRPNVGFYPVNIGQRWVVVAYTEKVIKFGDDLVTDYGEAYFLTQNLNCLCGEEICKYKDLFPDNSGSGSDSDSDSYSHSHSHSNSGASPAKKRKTTSHAISNGNVAVLVQNQPSARKTMKKASRTVMQAAVRGTKRG